MKTVKTMILSAGMVALMGANYAQASSAAATGGGVTLSSTPTSHSAAPIGNVETGTHGVRAPASGGEREAAGSSLPGDSNREKAPVLMAPTCATCAPLMPAALSNWQKLRLVLSVVLG
jgi:hypothetical protein